MVDERWPWPVKIYTLGRFAIEYDDHRSLSSRKESRKALDLLKLLISLGAGGKVSTGRLTALLWPDADVVAGRNSFENTLFRLRKILGDQQLQLRSGTLSLNTACNHDSFDEWECLAPLSKHRGNTLCPRSYTAEYLSRIHLQKVSTATSSIALSFSVIAPRLSMCIVVVVINSRSYWAYGHHRPPKHWFAHSENLSNTAYLSI